MAIRYQDAGVDIAAGNALVDAIKPLAAATRRAGALGGIGGFGALFDPRAAGFRDPVLVATTDGVGTKLRLAAATGRHAGIGVDLVAMCVNDLVVQGAEPLFFLDYFATGRLSNSVAAEVIAGISAGCRAAGCALVGGETAEMPDHYAPGDYDLAGFAVGAVERGEALPSAAHPPVPGDVVLGLAATGVHSNGYSLVRRIVDNSGMALDAAAPFAPDTSLGASLLTPTRIYVAACLAAARGGKVKAFAHITGGGLLENIPRVLPDGTGVALDAAHWTIPPVFGWLARAGPVDANEMACTFNCGIGMIAVVSPRDASAVATLLAAHGETVATIGTVTAVANGSPRVTVYGLARALAAA